MRVLAIVAFAAVIVLVVALLLVNASAVGTLVVALLIGCLAAFVLPTTCRFAIHVVRHHPRLVAALFVVAVVLVAGVYISSSFKSASVTLPPTGGAPVSVVNYSASIQPRDPTSDTFIVHEDASIQIEDKTIHHAATETVRSSQTAWALRRVTFRPFGADSSGTFTFVGTWPHTHQRLPISIALCEAQCPPTHIRLDLPGDAFYQAAGQAVKSTSTSVTWTSDQLDQGVSFSYVPANFRPFRPELGGLIAATSLSQGSLIVLGIILGALLSFATATWVGLKATAIIFAQGRVTGLFEHVLHRDHAPAGQVPNVGTALDAERTDHTLPTPPLSPATPSTLARDWLSLLEAAASLAWPIAMIMSVRMLQKVLLTLIRESGRDGPQSDK